MKLISFAFLIILSTVSSKAQFISDSLLIDGHYRVFHFKKPAPSAAKSSLIFLLHGSGGSGEQMINGAKKLESISQNDNFIVVYPDGYKHFWNECRKAATSAANVENIDENTFFSTMINYFVSKFRIDSNHVFAIGFSGGGHMAYKLAITMPEKIKAITAIVANLPDSINMDCIETKTPISVMIVNGTADRVNPYNGGEVKVQNVTLGTVRSTEKTFNYWAALAGYTGNPTVEKLPDVDSTDGKTIEKYSYQKNGNHEVVLYKVINGGHDSPNDINVYREAWEFFKRQ